MTPMTEPKLRFSDVVYSVETTPKSLRKWFQRDLVTLTFSNHMSGWRSFSYADIALLAIIRRLVDYGLGVEDASELANAVMFERSPAWTQQYRNSPKEVLAARFRNVPLLVWRDGDKWFWRLITPLGMEAPADTYLVLNVADIIDRAFKRAEESLSEGADDSEADEAAERKRK